MSYHKKYIFWEFFSFPFRVEEKREKNPWRKSRKHTCRWNNRSEIEIDLTRCTWKNSGSLGKSKSGFLTHLMGCDCVKKNFKSSRERKKINEWILMNNGWHSEEEEKFSQFRTFLHSNESLKTMEKFFMFTSHGGGKMESRKKWRIIKWHEMLLNCVPTICEICIVNNFK